MKSLLLVLSILSLGLGACVSINLGGKSTHRAKDVSYSAPTHPFVEENLGHVDKGWKNPQTGNSLSYLSDCGATQDPSLESLRSGVLSTLNDVEILSEAEMIYNGRAALRTLAKGKVDGIESQLDLVFFKKNNCIFIITYVALPETFAADHDQLNRFLQGFQAP